MPRLIDLTGERFGRLTVIALHPERKDYGGHKVVQWVCKCECGERCIVTRQLLRNGHTTSCRCLQSELSSEKLTNGRQTRAFAKFTTERPCRWCKKPFAAGRIVQYCSSDCWRLSRNHKRKEQRHKHASEP